MAVIRKYWKLSCIDASHRLGGFQLTVFLGSLNLSTNRICCLTLRRPIGRIRPEAMFFDSQGHVPEDIPKRRKNTPPKSTRRIFWKYSKRFSIWGKRWKTRKKFLDTGNTLYGFHSILNLRVKFWSASPNLFWNDTWSFLEW